MLIGLVGTNLQNSARITMSDQPEIEGYYSNEEDDDLPACHLQNLPLRDAVQKTLLPRNFAGLKTILDRSQLESARHPSSTSQSTKEPSEALKAFREISYMKFHKTLSSEEESYCSKESHVDSEDSCLFKKGYIFERKSQPISKDAVNKKVKKWEKVASEQLKEINKMYQHGRSKESFSVPLGLEANRKLNAGVPDDSSSCRSRISGQYNTEEEMDVRRNDDFMREVRRVLRSKKNPQTLEKRSLPEEYSRLIFKKSAFWRSREQQDKSRALMEKVGGATDNTDTGADGDNNSGPGTGIFDQISKMVLKNKIVKNSKTALQRNEVLRRVEAKRCVGSDYSDIAKEFTIKATHNIDPLPNPSGVQDQSNIEDADLQIDLPDLTHNKQHRLKKVESYLSTMPDVKQFSTGLPEISDLTAEREQSLFDSLTGAFLKGMASGNKYKITRNDKKLLSLIVKRYIDRGELNHIDELMNSNLDENLVVPPYENVVQREEYVLKKLIEKFIKRGMRDALEDLIAWIYYKLDAVNSAQEKKIAPTFDEKALRGMVNAFKNSGHNPSLDKLVAKLVKEHKKMHPGLNARQVRAVEEVMKDSVIEKFARLYMEHTPEGNSEPSFATSEFEINSRMENFNVNGRDVEIEWKSIKGGSVHCLESSSEHEIEEDSLFNELPDRKGVQERTTSNGKSMRAIADLQNEVNFVKERLEDIVWNIQQAHCRKKPGKPNRTCSLVKKRSVTVLGESIRGRCQGLERKLNFEERRKQMREEHVKWLLEQKEMLKAAKKKEAKNIERFTQALPKRLETIIARRNRSMERFNQRQDKKSSAKPGRK